MSGRTVLRFAIIARDGRRSSEWRVWTGDDKKPSDEVYLAPRNQAGDFKVSLHTSGYAQIGLSKPARDAARLGDNHAFSRWELADTELAPGWRPGFRITFPDSELIASPPVRADCLRVGVTDSGMAMAVLVLIGEPRAALPDPLRAFFIGDLDRKNGGRVAVFGIPVPFDNAAFTDALNHMVGSWRIPGLRSDFGPYGWASSTGPGGTIELTEFTREPEVSELPSLPSFPGEVLNWHEGLDAFSEASILCALLVCFCDKAPVLYVDLRSRCNHAHLEYDLGVLLESYKRGDLDNGWTRWSDGSASTGLTTRRRVDDAGIDASEWAPSPRPRSA
ncbi:hypothetical protein [Mycobacteroides sp. LB1]|uniref:hypothetical protein n=1 Tax=Mycobacteroides sp. LB1 TaxID=2750814 RepID=UPI0015E05464|nr:hypothetical protein [Mycobacteroides sp. LB1]